MMNENKLIRVIKYISGFLLFFCMNAFVITCCFILFLHNLEFTREQISDSAKLTLLNVMFISLVFLIFDVIRQKLFVERHIQKINDGLKEITKGHFDTQISYIKSINDTTSYNDIIYHINMMTKELKSVETLKTDFISNVSHEIKTPLAIISNYSTLLQASDIDDNERIEYAHTIHQTSNRLADLITHILKLNKLDNQQIYPDRKKYNLSEQLCNCLLQYENIWEEKDMSIETDIDEDIYVYEDDELLSIVWNNLISNALKFTDINGKVLLSLKEDKSDIIVKVIDTGCGMSKDTGEHIFDRFYQGDTSHKTSGNGLGLALVKKVIDIVGGEITVKSELGVGSEFEIRLKNRLEV